MKLKYEKTKPDLSICHHRFAGFGQDIHVFRVKNRISHIFPCLRGSLLLTVNITVKLARLADLLRELQISKFRYISSLKMREKPTNAAERPADLGTEAKREGKDRVGDTIFNVKYGKGQEQQMRGAGVHQRLPDQQGGEGRGG